MSCVSNDLALTMPCFQKYSIADDLVLQTAAAENLASDLTPGSSIGTGIGVGTKVSTDTVVSTNTSSNTNTCTNYSSILSISGVSSNNFK